MKKILENVHCKGFYLDVYEEGWFNKKYIAICPNFSFYYEGIDKSEALISIMASFEKAVDEKLKKENQMTDDKLKDYIFTSKGIKLNVYWDYEEKCFRGSLYLDRDLARTEEIEFKADTLEKIEQDFEDYTENLFRDYVAFTNLSSWV